MKLLLLPGLDGSGLLFGDFVGSLPEHLPAVEIAYPPSLGVFEDYVRVARNSIAAAGEDLVVVAESFSGPIAIDLLRDPPGNVKALVLVATFAQAPSRLLLALAAKMPGTVLQALAGPALDWLCLNGNTDEGLAKRTREVVQSLPPDLISARLKILRMLPTDLSLVLATSTVPVLLIKPRHDRLVSEKYFAEIEQCNPAVASMTIDGPHFLLQCCPRQCAEAIVDFITRRV